MTARANAFRTAWTRGSAPIVMVTAYDYATARAADAAGVDMVLVGDSAATTALGYASTREVSLDEMLMLTRAVKRGLGAPLLVGDLPFGTYEASDNAAVHTAQRFIEAGCDAVKLEGAGDMLPRARAVLQAGISVMGHVGLLPQSLRAGDAPRVAGRTADAAERLLADALALADAGCFAVVFEAVPADVSVLVVPLVDAPVIGIGAGVGTDGQVLVTYDLLGLGDGHRPRFAKSYAEVQPIMVDAMQRFAADVRARRFPGESHGYDMPEAERDLLALRLGTVPDRRDPPV